jgi:hypothetical protein
MTIAHHADGIARTRDRGRQIEGLHELPQPLLSRLLAARPDARRDGELPLLPHDVDWYAVAREAESHAIRPLFGHRLAGLGLVAELPEKVAGALEADCRHARIQHSLQQRDAERISAAMTAASVRHAFLKGFAYRQLLYSPPWVRLSGDIDILVDRANVDVARAVLRELGFTQASCAADYQNYRPATLQEIAEVEARHHELAQFVRNFRLENAPTWLLERPYVQRPPFAFEWVDGAPTLHSCVDVHWALHFWFARATPLDHLDQAEGLPRLRLEWNLLFSSFKLYFESFDRPRHGFAQLADLAALLELPVDWPLLRSLVRAWRLEDAAFYALSAAERLSGRRVLPAALLDEWAQPARGRVGGGDFVPFLVGRRVPGDFLWRSGP